MSGRHCKCLDARHMSGARPGLSWVCPGHSLHCKALGCPAVFASSIMSVRGMGCLHMWRQPIPRTSLKLEASTAGHSNALQGRLCAGHTQDNHGHALLAGSRESLAHLCIVGEASARLLGPGLGCPMIERRPAVFGSSFSTMSLTVRALLQKPV
jgi:hypothetical protein